MRVRVYALHDHLSLNYNQTASPDGKKTEERTYRMGIGPASRLSRET